MSAGDVLLRDGRVFECEHVEVRGRWVHVVGRQRLRNWNRIRYLERVERTFHAGKVAEIRWTGRAAA
jgi:hypothetical protein